MSLDRETVRRIAYLARIKVEDERLDQIAGELDGILGFVEQLSEVDTDGVEAMTSVTELTMPLRADVINDGDCRDKVLANATDPFDGFYTVPKVVE
ncbi:MAG: Asp-tRNA(Asn)/Glu-tRNA(Gln) amidotransferase subunit GatC [Rhodospirillales bacterium]|jgi:aspartyl-tRNA(Asn)/glutamyl-tRNA(Gln) amidotransferase subunit C|nr:Asp-tRNA(Asn)/Glu-tRNA(Gln) amidotransferase subunit GatC [Rhodospirillales bacterium]